MDMWASIVSTGVVCIFYTSVVRTLKLFPSSKKFVSIFYLRGKVILEHDQPLWQASKQAKEEEQKKTKKRANCYNRTAHILEPLTHPLRTRLVVIMQGRSCSTVR